MSAQPDAAHDTENPLVEALEEGVSEVAGQPFTALEAGSAIALGVISLLIAGLMGLLLATLAEEHRLTAAGIGRAAMLEALSTGLATGLAGIVLKPVRLRLVGALATALLVVADLATLRASGGSVFLVRMLAGVPEGLMLWIAIGMISRTATPERWAAVLFTGMGVSQMAMAALLSAFVLPAFGANGGYAALAAGAALALPLCLVLPRRYGAVPGQENEASGAPPPLGWLALFGTLCFTAASAAVGVYVVPLATQAGLSIAAGRTAISVGLGFQILGGVLATALAGRVRYLVIFWTCTAGFLAVWVTYALHAPAWVFVAATGLSGLVGMLAGPFLVPLAIEADPTRRAAMQSGAVQLLAGALGPFLASLLVKEHDGHRVLILGAGLLTASLAVVSLVHALTGRRDRAAG